MMNCFGVSGAIHNVRFEIHFAGTTDSRCCCLRPDPIGLAFAPGHMLVPFLGVPMPATPRPAGSRSAS